MGKAKMLLILVTTAMTLFGCQQSRHAKKRSKLPFIGNEWIVAASKGNGSMRAFEQKKDSCFIVRFTDNRFRGFDGEFRINGTSKDTSSPYATRYYTGFYEFRDQPGELWLTWFKHISWSFKFHRHPELGRLAGSFNFTGTFRYSSDSLIFFHSDQRWGSDTALVLVRRNQETH